MKIGDLVKKKGTNKIGIITWVSYSLESKVFNRRWRKLFGLVSDKMKVGDLVTDTWGDLGIILSQVGVTIGG